jgi:hypothetical protein
MAFKNPIAIASLSENPDRLFLDLPRRKHPSLYDHQGSALHSYVAKALIATDIALKEYGVTVGALTGKIFNYTPEAKTEKTGDCYSTA